MDKRQQLLTVESLQVKFKREKDIFTAVNSIDFQLHKREILGIVGESGSGKSMTASSIMQLNRFISNCETSGQINWQTESDTLDLNKLSNKRLEKIRGRDIGMIFQEPMSSLNPVLRCGYQVAEVLRTHKGMDKTTAKAAVLNLFEQVQLDDPQRIFISFPNELSGGQRQRVMIAMAIACKPQLLIADEPTTALDAFVEQAVVQLLLDLRDQMDMAILFISHDLNLVRSIADRVIVMRNGLILEQGTSSNIFQHPQHAYTKGLLACRPDRHRSLRRLPTIGTFESEDADLNFLEILNQFEEEHIKTENQEEEQSIMLEVAELSVTYPLRRASLFGPKQLLEAVRDVSFHIKSGYTVGLVGESGSGKSSIGKAITKLIPNRVARLQFDNGLTQVDLNKVENPAYKGIQMIFQDPYNSLNPRKTVGDAIIEPIMVHQLAQNKQEAIEKAKKLLEDVGLEPDGFNRYPNQFSGGQRQRIGLARALALEPKLIICDECVSALDVSVQAQILNLLSDLKEQKQMSYLFISHDLSVVKHMSDWILVMKNGQIIEEGTPENIFYQPKHPYTKQLVNSME